MGIMVGATQRRESEQIRSCLICLFSTRSVPFNCPWFLLRVHIILTISIMMLLQLCSRTHEHLHPEFRCFLLCMPKLKQ